MTEQPINDNYGTDYHVPVLVDEVLEWLDVGPGKIFVDGTLGGGGHTQAILDASAPDGRVIAIDRDPDARAEAAERLASYGTRVRIVAGNYGDVEAIVEAEGLGRVDGFLVDAGVSSHQFDAAERGFSFREAGPLDMRMGPDSMTVAELFETTTADELGQILAEYGEIKGAYRMARGLLMDWEAGKIKTTTDLAHHIESIAGYRGSARRKTNIHPATLVFQALRIAVNDELSTLKNAVQAIPKVVKSGGRAVFISFHSLEDRIVKQGFQALSKVDMPRGLPVPADQLRGEVDVLTRKPIMARDEEIEKNPRSRSAKLRAVQVL